jgi:protein-S-isoprenylcysteine O-methyltransferase Ste14
MPRVLLGVGSILLLVLPSGGNITTGISFTEWTLTRLWDEPVWLNWGLVAAIACSFVFCWWARLHLGRLWSGFVTVKENHRIVDTGPYGLVRHPIYAGVMFAALMTGLIKANPAALAGAALMMIGLSRIAKIEEQFLSEQLGAEAYAAYRRRVRMLIPIPRLK